MTITGPNDPGLLVERCFVGGAWMGDAIDVSENPATGEALARVQSGIGRAGSHHGIEEFTEIKCMLVAGLEA
jgi:acyl-CoA reductase-like NAD-dependent aldehyde dehydrogenase